MSSKTFQPLRDECAGYLQLLQSLLHLQGCLGNLVGPKIEGRITEVTVCLPAFKKLQKQKSIFLSSAVKPTKSLSWGGCKSYRWQKEEAYYVSGGQCLFTLRAKTLEPPVKTQKHSLSAHFPPGNHSDVSSYLSQPLHSSGNIKWRRNQATAKLGNSIQSGLPVAEHSLLSTGAADWGLGHTGVLTGDPEGPGGPLGPMGPWGEEARY